MKIKKRNLAFLVCLFKCWNFLRFFVLFFSLLFLFFFFSFWLFSVFSKDLKFCGGPSQFYKEKKDKKLKKKLKKKEEKKEGRRDNCGGHFSSIDDRLQLPASEAANYYCYITTSATTVLITLFFFSSTHSNRAKIIISNNIYTFVYLCFSSLFLSFSLFFSLFLFYIFFFLVQNKCGSTYLRLTRLNILFRAVCTQ